MKLNFWLFPALLLLAVPGLSQIKPVKALGVYQTIVVEKAIVEDSPHTKELPSGLEVAIPKNIVAALLGKKLFTKVIDGTEANAPTPEGKTLSLVTQVISFDKGSRFLRSAFGPGPGAAKVKVRFVLKDALSGQEILKLERRGKYYGTWALWGGTKEYAVSEAAGDVVDGLIKDIKKNR